MFSHNNFAHSSSAINHLVIDIPGMLVSWLVCFSPGLSPQMCLGLNANEIQIPYNKHHKLSSMVN